MLRALKSIRLIQSIVLATSFAMLFGGCAGLKGAPARSTDTDLSSADPLYSKYLSAFYAQGANKRDIRNQYLEVGMALTDRAYSDYRKSIYEERVSGAFGVDMSILGLGAFGAGTASASAKTAASALSALITGGKASYDKNFFFDQALPAVISEMEARRADLRIQILNGMLLDADRFPMAAAKSYLEQYFDAGSMLSAITSVNNHSAEHQKASEERLANRTVAQITTDLRAKGFNVIDSKASSSGEAFQKCLSEDGRMEPALEVALTSYLTASGVDTSNRMALANFISQPTFEALRKNAIAIPNIATLLATCKK